ncbi:diguanylate cyclase/phosphodiesterase [Pseudomonas sp. XWY-1]|nr:diguanylate cyclase/phosphodiesterase [Pseudomonas sp. XWY-1]
MKQKNQNFAAYAGPFAGKPAPATACAHHRWCVGAGLPANTMAAATVKHGWKLVSRSGPFAGKPAPTTACAHHRV